MTHDEPRNFRYVVVFIVRAFRHRDNGDWVSGAAGVDVRNFKAFDDPSSMSRSSRIRGGLERRSDWKEGPKSRRNNELATRASFKAIINNGARKNVVTESK